MLRTSSYWLGSVPAALFLLHCSSSPHADGDGLESPAGVAGSAGSSGYVPQDPIVEPTCVPSADADEPDDELADTNCDGIDGDSSNAIFVDPLGDDENDGSLEAPVASVSSGVRRAAESGKAVYVCSATYEESLLVEAQGVAIYGGYDCNDGWKRGSSPFVLTPKTGSAFVVRDVPDPVIVRRAKFVAPDASTAGGSSIAAIVLRSANVDLKHVELVAGKGAGGIEGAPARVFTEAPPTAPAGRSAARVSNCLDGEGKPIKSCQGIIEGPVEAPPELPMCDSDSGPVGRPWGTGGKGGNGFQGIVETEGSGASAGGQIPGADGAASTDGFGAVDENGLYLPTNAGKNGKFGARGTAGRGGAGGMGKVWIGDIQYYLYKGGAGGTGGTRGCGGYPGQGGGGGGASIALVALDSAVTLERATLTTGAGGAGGVPSAGQDGQVGGKGGKGGLNNAGLKYSGDGESGGKGGKGGSGGPGAGGPSLGIAYFGPLPVLRASTLEIGVGGLGAESIVANTEDAADGLSREFLDVQSIVEVQ